MFRRSFIGSFFGSLFGLSATKEESSGQGFGWNKGFTKGIPQGIQDGPATINSARLISGEPLKPVIGYSEPKQTIRIWKMGSLEHGVIPTDEAVQKLANILTTDTKGGSLDIIWNEFLTCEVVQGGSVNIIASPTKDGTTYYKINADGTVETILENK